ncbi:MAG: hypothetical protein M3010_06935, partial [Candidatus Dormibacteraeota bacterium]|nr:hypothetical protein [Candidatus Dormibacteraeota bacterium]
LYAGMATNTAPAHRWPPAAWPPAIRLLHLLALTAGLSMTNHFLSNLLWVGLAILLLAPIGRARPAWAPIFRHAGTVVAAGLLPLLLYLYLPIRAGMQPLLDWGSPDTWGDFWRHVTVWQFRVYIGQSAGGLGSYVADAFLFAANQFGPWLGTLLLVPIAAGVVYLWRTDRGVLAATVATALIDIVYTLNYQIREVVVYYIPFYMIALWWAGLGIGQGILWARRLPAGAVLSRAPAAGLAVGALAPLLGLALNWGAAGHQNDDTAALYVRNAFKNFAPNAVVETDSWDLVSGAYYLQGVLHERPDIAIVDKQLLRYPFYANYVKRLYPDLVGKIGAQYATFQTLDRNWVDTGQAAAALPGAFSTVLNGFVDTNLGARPVYLVFTLNDAEEQDVLGKHQAALVPDGYGYRVAAGPNDRGTADPQFDLHGLIGDRVALDEVAYSVVWIYPQALQNIGAYLSATGQTAEQKQTGARLQAQAASLAWLAAARDSRPHLR